MITIQPRQVQDCQVTVPGSKSYTHRILIAASLSDGTCVIENCLKSEDTLLTIDALQQMGIHIKQDGVQTIVHGKSGKLSCCEKPIYLGNSGTSMRLLAGVASLGKYAYTLTGTKRMQERPIQDLLDGLDKIGVQAKSVNQNGLPPIIIDGSKMTGGKTLLDCSVSSQYLSSLLLIGPYVPNGLDISVTGLVSRPYVDMTIDIMKKFGVEVVQQGYDRFQVAGNQVYRSGDYVVEPDCSQAGYFWAAGAITGACIKVSGINNLSRQGDVRFVEVLKQMGCKILYEEDGITVSGNKLNGIEVDMSDMPDIVPTLAVVAAFAQGITYIKNIAHLRAKESDRIYAVECELSKMGIDVKSSEDSLTIIGGKPKGAVINTYEDHRIAMCFAIAGLITPDVIIEDEGCVKKSFPNFWEVFGKL